MHEYIVVFLFEFFNQIRLTTIICLVEKDFDYIPFPFLKRKMEKKHITVTNKQTIVFIHEKVLLQ